MGSSTRQSYYRPPITSIRKLSADDSTPFCVPGYPEHGELDSGISTTFFPEAVSANTSFGSDFEFTFDSNRPLKKPTSLSNAPTRAGRKEKQPLSGSSRKVASTRESLQKIYSQQQYCLKDIGPELMRRFEVFNQVPTRKVHMCMLNLLRRSRGLIPPESAENTKKSKTTCPALVRLILLPMEERERANQILKDTDFKTWRALWNQVVNSTDLKKDYETKKDYGGRDDVSEPPAPKSSQKRRRPQQENTSEEECEARKKILRNIGDEVIRNIDVDMRVDVNQLVTLCEFPRLARKHATAKAQLANEHSQTNLLDGSRRAKSIKRSINKKWSDNEDSPSSYSLTSRTPAVGQNSVGQEITPLQSSQQNVIQCQPQTLKQASFHPGPDVSHSAWRVSVDPNQYGYTRDAHQSSFSNGCYTVESNWTPGMQHMPGSCGMRRSNSTIGLQFERYPESVIDEQMYHSGFLDSGDVQLPQVHGFQDPFSTSIGFSIPFVGNQNPNLTEPDPSLVLGGPASLPQDAQLFDESALSNFNHLVMSGYNQPSLFP